MKIFRLTKTRNGSFHGPRFLYEVRDASGRKLSSTSDNKDFVAGIVGRHEIEKRPGEFIFSLTGMTQTPHNLGKALTSGGRSSVYAIALIETVPIGNEFRPVIRTANGDDFGDKGSAVDWSKLLKEFRAAIVATGVDIETFHTVKPAAGGHAAFWIDDTDPGDTSRAPAVADSITKEFDETFNGQDIATPDPASSTNGPAIVKEVGNRIRGRGSDARDFLRDLDERSGKEPGEYDAEFVDKIDFMLNNLTSEAFVMAAFAIHLARETEDGTTNVTDVRQLSRARRKLVVQIDEHARRLCKEFTKRIFGDDRDAELHLQFADAADEAAGSVTPDSASDPDEEPPEHYEAKCYKCGAIFYMLEPPPNRPDCGACSA
jgi:hypothetical protein